MKTLVDIYGSCWQHSLTHLDLSCNSLSDVPKSINQLLSLQTLYLSMNNCIKFPKHVCKLRTLTSLNLRCNKIAKLEDKTFNPISFSKMLGKKKRRPICSSLKTLNLSHNYLVQFPEALANLKVLQELDLSNNVKIRDTIEKDGILGSWANSLHMLNLDNCGLQKFPSQVSTLANIRHIHLSNNAIKTVPKLGNLPFLTTLTITSCNIEDLSPIFPQKMLKKINAAHNKIHSIPQLSAHSWNTLEELLLSNNHLTQLGPEISSYTSLILLDCCRNNIATVDSSLSQLVQLKYLNLSNNSISKLPQDVFSGMKNLRTLNLSHNYLETLPSLAKCSKLQKLNAMRNSLKVFPQDLNYLSGSLQELDLSYNQIIQIDPVLFSCELLENLDLSSNMIQCIISHDCEESTTTTTDNKLDISNLYSLKKLKLDGNGITELPSSIVKLKNVDTLRISFQHPLFDEQIEWASKYKINVINTYEKPLKIDDSLYVGSRDSISNFHVLDKKHYITNVLLLCNRRVHNYNNDQFNVLYRSEIIEEMNDSGKLFDLLYECNEFITKTRSSQMNCLVACDDKKIQLPVVLIAHYISNSEGTTTLDIPSLMKTIEEKMNESFSRTQKIKMESILRMYEKNKNQKNTTNTTTTTQQSTNFINVLEDLDTSHQKLPLIKTLLMNDVNRAYFKLFCERERSSENICFWEEVELRYKRVQDGYQRYAFARQIYDTFIDIYEAPYQLNIDQKLVTDIETQLDSYSHLDSMLDDTTKDTAYKRMSLAVPSHTFFDVVTNAVERIMLDTAQRFQKSDLYEMMEKDTLNKGVSPDVTFLIQNGPSSFRSLSGL
jgi:Leucine-rich repeat (LRR) protein